LLVIALIALGGYAIFQMGVAQGMAAQLPEGAQAPVPVPYYHPHGIGFFPFFGFFGLIFKLLFFFLLFGLIARLFFFSICGWRARGPRGEYWAKRWKHHPGWGPPHEETDEEAGETES
jgi:hypothetical protein